jgi:anti-sigma-K factor RskA
MEAKPAEAEPPAQPAVIESLVPARVPPVPSAAPEGADIILLSGRVRRWRMVSVMTGALAACFFAVAVLQGTSPDLLPTRLQPKPKIVEVLKTVEVPSARPAEFVAVFQRDDASPAFLLTFDLEKRSLTVRRVGAEEQAGKSYELWLVSDKFPAPRSLGVIGAAPYTVRQAAPEYDPVIINRATYAISLEPEGGSPTGAPTGPVLYHGRLLQTTAPDFPARTP